MSTSRPSKNKHHMCGILCLLQVKYLHIMVICKHTPSVKNEHSLWIKVCTYQSHLKMPLVRHPKQPHLLHVN